MTGAIMSREFLQNALSIQVMSDFHLGGGAATPKALTYDVQHTGHTSFWGRYNTPETLKYDVQNVKQKVHVNASIAGACCTSISGALQLHFGHVAFNR